jgi:hypothetical protein
MAALMFFTCPVSAPGRTSTGTDEGTNSGAVRAARSLKLPYVRPTPIPGFNDDFAYIHSIDVRIADLRAKAEREEAPRNRSAYFLAAANELLAFRLEPVCSRRILGLPVNADDFAPKETANALDQIDQLLDLAEAAIQDTEGGSTPPPAGLGQPAEALEGLRAFAAAMRAYLTPDRDQDAVGAARRAASGLSPLMEREDPRLVAAATLWQALLRAMEEDPERALSVIEPALSDPDPEAMPHAFFLRRLRCGLIAKRGGADAALAILLQLEERCHEWFPSDVERAAAIRAVQLERLRVLALWHDKLPESTATAERQWCRKRFEALAGEAFADRSDTVLRLTPAIPILIEPPDETAPAPSTPDKGA